MGHHPTPTIYPVPTPQTQERLKRRLQMPNAMAPVPKARKIQVLSWAISLCRLKLSNFFFFDIYIFFFFT